MRAATRSRYGSPDVIEIRDVPIPHVPADRMLVRVRACSLNKADWYSLTGTPLIARPQMRLRPDPLFGTDFAGVVEAVGSEVAGFEPGNEVFGGANGALAEYVVVRNPVPKPADISFAEAAAIPTAGVTALQALRDHGAVEPGECVLINGASGGVGTFSVQVAKVLGAEVTAVCSSSKVDLVRSIGADEVIDYTEQDFTRLERHFDLLIDVAGGQPWRAVKRVLAADARLIIVGAPTGNRLVGPLPHIFGTRLAAVPSRRKVEFFIARFHRADLELLGEMTATGEIRPVIDREYELAQVADALSYLGEGHAAGKVVITV